MALFVNAGFNIVCCFDGKSGPLKTNHAYLSRYGNNQEKQEELKRLYETNSFETDEEELKNIAEVKKLRKELAGFNRPDLLFELKKKIEQR